MCHESDFHLFIITWPLHYMACLPFTVRCSRESNLPVFTVVDLHTNEQQKSLDAVVILCCQLLFKNQISELPQKHIHKHECASGNHPKLKKNKILQHCLSLSFDRFDLNEQQKMCVPCRFNNDCSILRSAVCFCQKTQNHQCFDIIAKYIGAPVHIPLKYSIFFSLEVVG